MIQTIHSQEKIIILIQMVNCIMTHRHPDTLQNLMTKYLYYLFNSYIYYCLDLHDV